MDIAVFTLGCKTNLYESGQIVSALLDACHNATHGLKRADVVVINTCAVTSEAEKKSRQAIARAKKLNPNVRIIVTGCASEKDAKQFRDIAGVTYIKGTAGKESIVDAINNFEATAVVDVEALPSAYVHTLDATQELTRAFVKIQDGCNNFCSYCIVPYLRGRSRSKQVADIVREVNNAHRSEVVLIGIDISQYGRDIDSSLAQLFTALAGCGKRIRLGSLEHSVVSSEVLAALKQLNFCPHFHLSLQSGCDSVLKRMNRHYTTAEFYDGLQLIRQYFPDVAFTTDVIVGFPEETEEEFAATVNFVEKCGFSDIHVFPFSPREGTVAYTMPDLPPAIKKHRAKVMNELKQRIASEFITKAIGETHEVLVEERTRGLWAGYSKNYIRVYIDDNSVKSGDIVNVKLTAPYLDGAKGTIIK
jgi:threonylcarbamoyladenosine tRNA methylthiotransferase MtaB